MIYRNYKNVPVGEMREGIFVKRVNPAKHFMKIYQGYGISQDIFDQLKKDGCKEIRINTGDDLYRIKIEDFEQHKILANFDDPQVFCALKWFESKNSKQNSLLDINN